jgi:membrane-anchored protein YejM (alkaline phosphatase superfamily)
MSEKEIQGITDIYDDSIRYADKLIGELQERLNGEVVFILIADHGEALAERGIYGHFYPSLHEENIHVSLVIGGDINENERYNESVSLTKLPEMIREISEGNIWKPESDKPAISTTFDDRRSRNLLSVRNDETKVMVSATDSEIHFETYDLKGNNMEPSESKKLQDQSKLGHIAYKRLFHENEILNIEDAVSQLHQKNIFL